LKQIKIARLLMPALSTLKPLFDSGPLALDGGTAQIIRTTLKPIWIVGVAWLGDPRFDGVRQIQ
jgi:hypothetical protein